MRVEELSTKDLESIYRCFMYFDRERTGYISVTEFGMALRCLKLIPTEGQIEQFVLVSDPKKTGRIRFETFANAAAQIWTGDETKLQTEIWKAFLQFDKADTGTIAADEMKRILTEYGLEPIPEREASKVIRIFSNKKTNMIEYGFIIRAWQR
ncbi:calmodulin [Paragonimus westermani]|uniref:Calmodulin n=1 Tax=Paragonimus westermani TaxID=34504 RepID=A0A5J4NJJ9_9TREM|nr:calmodulin [Paragonimus westermani]